LITPAPATFAGAAENLGQSDRHPRRYAPLRIDEFRNRVSYHAKGVGGVPNTHPEDAMHWRKTTRRSPNPYILGNAKVLNFLKVAEQCATARIAAAN
jgi:hypothetical protein